MSNPIVAAPIGKAIVIATSGTTVRMREEPNGAAKVLAHVPIGTIVEVMEYGTDWKKVHDGNFLGWMMASFLRDADQPVNQPVEPTTAQKIDILWAAYKASSGA